MDTLSFTIVILLGSCVAGFLGSLTGLGGGVVIIPLLTLAFKVDIRYAIGASLVSVIATSSGAAAAYVKEGFSNVRIGMFLETATTLGALAGAAMAAHLPVSFIAVVFGLVLIHSAYATVQKHQPESGEGPGDPWAARLRLNGAYPTAEGIVPYRVEGVVLGYGLMAIAGMLSGLLGIGSGAIKVLAMDRVMRIPFKVSTATSNFMIGVTAAASAGIYLHRGYIDPGLSMPVMLGVLIGSMTGAKILFSAKTARLRIVFAVVIFVLGIEMVYSGLTGRL